MTKPPSVQHQRRLMLAVAAGDHAAFSRLYDILSVATYAACRRQLAVQAEADLAMEATWLYVWQNAQTLSHQPGSPSETIMAAAEMQLRGGSTV